MPTRIKVVTAYSHPEVDENYSFGIDVGFNDTLRRVEMGYDGDDLDMNFPYAAIDAIIEALKRIQAEYAE